MTRPNKLTPGSNLRWESSRMFLPEHREQLLERRREQKKRVRPDLDEDQLSIIDAAIADSLQNKTEITLTIYDPFGDKRMTGYMVRAARNRGRVLIQCADFDEWIDRDRIISAE